LQPKTEITPPPIERNVRAAALPVHHGALNNSDLERLLLIIDTSLKVRLRHHFFSWTQGALQALLPHDGLVCVLHDPRMNQPHVDFFTSMLVVEQDADYLRRANAGLYADLSRNWRRNERRAVTYVRDCAHGEFDDAALLRLGRLPFRRLVAHGMCGLSGEISGFFGLLGASGEAAPRELYLFEALLPHLYATWLRVVSEQPPAVPAADSPIELAVLTGRQIEIMRWVHEGKSNIEIGLILGISPLTVKNHVQKILRKLNVQNRTQAVAKCLSRSILKSPLRS
jgi:transcriptional regulator EpsA